MWTGLKWLCCITAVLISHVDRSEVVTLYHCSVDLYVDRSEVAMLYNDRAVLENHHISSAFRMLREDENNIVSNLSKEEFR